MISSILVFSGRQGKPVADKICERLSVSPGEAKVGRFGDGEVEVELLSNVRGSDVFIVNPTNPPADNFVEMVLLARAARSSSARRVTLVPTYLGYNRQERKVQPRVPISAKTMIEFLKLSGADRALLTDLHSEATAAHFEPMVFDHLYASYVSIPYLKQVVKAPFVVASPDTGGVPRARKYAQHLGGGEEDLVIFSKARVKPGKIANGSVHIIGDVEGKNVLFVDDIIDSGGTMIEDAKVAKAAGAQDIYVFATHGLFSKGLEVFKGSQIKEIVVTDTVYHEPDKLKADGVNLTVCSIAPLLAQAIRRTHEEASLSALILK